MGELSEAVYARCLPYARRVCPRDPAIDAEDLVIMAWIRTRRWLDALPGDDDRVRYLQRGIKSAAIDYRRALSHSRSGISPEVCPLRDDLLSAPNDVESEVIARVDLAAIIASVPPPLLLYALGWMWSEIAAMAGVPISTPRVQAHRWRQAHMEA